MNDSKFDFLANKLTSDWDFKGLISLYNESELASHRKLEYCVLLADLGMLEELYHYITVQGLYNLKAVAADPSTKPLARGDIKSLFTAYENEILPWFDRTQVKSFENSMLRYALASDTSLLENYILTNINETLDIQQPSKGLMYLSFALGRLLKKTSHPEIYVEVLKRLNSFKSISSIRKAYLTSLIARALIPNEKVLFFPQLRYNDLHRLLAVIYSQKSRYSGASDLYEQVSTSVRHQLVGGHSGKFLGSDVKPKVAVCISGMYRCGNVAIDSICENIVNPLDADVFLHSWEVMQEWPGLGGAGDEWIMRTFRREIFEKCPEQLKSKAAFKSLFPRTFNKLDTPQTTGFSTDRLPKQLKLTRHLIENEGQVSNAAGIPIDKLSSRGSTNQAKMFYGIYKSHELVVEHEKANGFRYDYIVRCRPDVALRNKLSIDVLDKLAKAEVGMEFSPDWGPQDQVWYAQRSAALAMASLWTASVQAECLSPFPRVNEMRAHNLILGWMTANHLQPAESPIKRNLNLVNGQAIIPDFSKELCEDLQHEAIRFADDPGTIEFFSLMQKFGTS
ncbi:hypothetical protein ACSFEV_18945 [Pseudomonas fulva]|uniref:hypothetical protein n=1 Tax=Pseudomonas fulva TaxID=47880 RepID=UPI003EEAF884